VRAAVHPARRAALRRRLLAWWDAGHRDLPWRSPRRAADPYRVWLAEAMLQQTRVAAVVPYYRRFLARWPTLEALARARDDEVFAAWSGLGYYARCRNLLAAARAALREHGGLPASLAALRALPGIGPYTAGAVASIAFAIPAAAVDGNAARVLARLFALRGDAAGRSHRERLWRIARELVGEVPVLTRPLTLSVADRRRRSAESKGRAGDWNQALMELGATVCGRRPWCGRCPLARLCAARAAGLEGSIPGARRRPRRRPLTLACAIVARRGSVLLFRQPAGGLFGGLLTFPSAEVKEGADARRALVAALRRRGWHVLVGEEIASVERVLTHRNLLIRAFSCRLRRPPGTSSASAGLGWTAWTGLGEAAMPAAMKALLPGLAESRADPLAFSARVVYKDAPLASGTRGSGRRARISRTTLTRGGRNV
jgi:A/G-specific adenine glycosylase